MLVTSYRLIRSGSLHAANGGYLILDAEKLLTDHYLWEALKRALKKQDHKNRTSLRRHGADEHHNAVATKFAVAGKSGVDWCA